MGALKERTIYYKDVEGKIADVETDGHWLDANETVEGGASLSMPFFDVQCVDQLNQHLLNLGKKCEIVFNNDGLSFVVIDEEGKQVAFEEIMKGISA